MHVYIYIYIHSFPPFYEPKAINPKPEDLEI